MEAGRLSPILSPMVEAQAARDPVSASAATALARRPARPSASRCDNLDSQNRIRSQRHSNRMAEPSAIELICPNQGSHGNPKPLVNRWRRAPRAGPPGGERRGYSRHQITGEMRQSSMSKRRVRAMNDSRPAEPPPVAPAAPAVDTEVFAKNVA